MDVRDTAEAVGVNVRIAAVCFAVSALPMGLILTRDPGSGGRLEAIPFVVALGVLPAIPCFAIVFYLVELLPWDLARRFVAAAGVALAALVVFAFLSAFEMPDQRKLAAMAILCGTAAAFLIPAPGGDRLRWVPSWPLVLGASVAIVVAGFALG